MRTVWCCVRRCAQGVVELAAAIERIVGDEAALVRVSAAARAKALSWDESANAQRLAALIRSRVLRQ